MTSSAFFFLYLLPFVLAGGGWIAVLLNERHNRHRSNLHPGE
jgi:drug/metabolite transporter (DMT)-like permease